MSDRPRRKPHSEAGTCYAWPPAPNTFFSYGLESLPKVMIVTKEMEYKYIVMSSLSPFLKTTSKEGAKKGQSLIIISNMLTWTGCNCGALGVKRARVEALWLNMCVMCHDSGFIFTQASRVVHLGQNLISSWVVHHPDLQGAWNFVRRGPRRF